jgi:mono/diheme cytochrome c family protein
MQSRFAGFCLFLLTILAAVSPLAAANVPRGAQLAQQWCANCHVIGGKPPATIQQGPPSFRAIAQGPLTADQLRASCRIRMALCRTWLCHARRLTT